MPAFKLGLLLCLGEEEKRRIAFKAHPGSLHIAHTPTRALELIQGERERERERHAFCKLFQEGERKVFVLISFVCIH